MERVIKFGEEALVVIYTNLPALPIVIGRVQFMERNRIIIAPQVFLLNSEGKEAVGYYTPNGPLVTIYAESIGAWKYLKKTDLQYMENTAKKVPEESKKYYRDFNKMVIV